jgi:hypothetical protein
MLLILFIEDSSDDQTPDFARSSSDLVQFSIPQVPSSGVIVDITIATWYDLQMNLKVTASISSELT